MDNTIPVLGVGTVILPTKRTPNGRHGNHTQLVLHDVLHVPSLISNVIGWTKDNNLQFCIGGGESSKSNGTIKDNEGTPLAYFDPSKKLFQVKLSGPPVGPIVGPSVLNDPNRNTLVWVRACWAPSERARWEEYKQGNQSRTSHSSEPSSAPPKNDTMQNPQPDLGYTKEEKAWLKIHYGDEYKFLRDHGLSIYDDDEREEGRAIVRSFMAKEDEDDDEEEEGEESDEDMEGHMVDYLFDEPSLCWIEKHYGTSMNFMYSYGLKFYDQDDCEEAQVLVKSLMREGQ